MGKEIKTHYDVSLNDPSADPFRSYPACGSRYAWVYTSDEVRITCKSCLNWFKVNRIDKSKRSISWSKEQ